MNFAKNFTLPPDRGTVQARLADKNHGLRSAWFDSWHPLTDTEHAIIVEDDIELSPQWFMWLKKAWLSYRHRDDIAGDNDNDK